MRGALDPRICNITLDANAVDRDGGPRDGLVDRLLGLRQTGKINFVVPGSVRTEVQHPRTPHDVKSAVLGEIFTQNRRLWVRLREKGGKRHAMPCHHNLEEYLTGYLDGAEHDRPRHHQAHAHRAAASERLCDDRPARGRRRHRHQARQPQFAGDGDHCLSQERRHARKGRGDGEPCLDTHDTALRSPARRSEPR
jgi:hypothetical protein